MFNSGHMSEHLIWAPDARDDFAFTMYAIDCEEVDDIKASIINQLQANSIDRCEYFSDFVGSLVLSFGGANRLTDKDWDDIYPYWANA